MQKKLELITSKHRDWQSFSNEKLSEKLSFVDWNINFDDVQEYWNTLENKIIVIVDEIFFNFNFNGVYFGPLHVYVNKY